MRTLIGHTTRWPPRLPMRCSPYSIDPPIAGGHLSSYKAINRCRIADSTHLVSVLNLGHQALTGVFPHSPAEHVTTGPLEIVWCPDSGLLQLRHSYEPSEMYGENYG